MSELSCPLCNADSYLNPNIKIYTSPCFHRLCESCLYSLFQHGGYAKCPQCGLELRRVNFTSSTFEDVEVERELKMRKLMNRHLLRDRADFQDENTYNDYLEEYENVLDELLELNNEVIAKERILEIKTRGGMLVPIKATTDILKEEQPKRIKKEENWCLYEPLVPNIFNIEDDAIIPKDFMSPYEPGGLKKREILDFVAYSLIEINK